MDRGGRVRFIKVATRIAPPIKSPRTVEAARRPQFVPTARRAPGEDWSLRSTVCRHQESRESLAQPDLVGMLWWWAGVRCEHHVESNEVSEPEISAETDPALPSHEAKPASPSQAEPASHLSQPSAWASLSMLQAAPRAPPEDRSRRAACGPRSHHRSTTFGSRGLARSAPACTTSRARSTSWRARRAARCATRRPEMADWLGSELVRATSRPGPGG